MTQKEGNISVEGSTISSTALDWVTWDEANSRLILHKKGTGADAGFPFSSGTDIEVCVIGGADPIMVVDSTGVKLGTLTIDDVSFLSAITYTGNNRAMGLTLAKDGYYGELGYTRGTLTNTPTFYSAGTNLSSGTWIGSGNLPTIFYMKEYTP